MVTGSGFSTTTESLKTLGISSSKQNDLIKQNAEQFLKET